MDNNKVLRKFGWPILIILSLIPLVLWLFELPFSLRFSNLAASFKNLGDIAGLIGMAMFSLVIILSARLKIFEKFFNGMNDVYVAHHTFGGISFCLLLFHPLLLSYNYISSSFMDAALFLLPSAGNWGLNFGIFGLFVMIITIVITFYTKLKYQVWKYTHKFLGLAFIFAFLHTFMTGGDIASNFSLKIYFFVLGALAIIAYLYRALFSSYLVRTFEYSVKNIKQLPDKIWEIEFLAKNDEIKFTSGQFGFIKLFNEYLSKEAHPFSFSSTSSNPLKIAIKELGDYTNKINQLKVGDSAIIEGPYGVFNFNNFTNKKQIWIAGGIGITPFLSMIRGLTEKDFDYKISLYYSVKDENCLAFKEELELLTQKNKNLNVIFWLTSKNGFLTADLIKKSIQNLAEFDILMCGPGPMMSALKKQLLELGTDKKQIHSEEFQLY